jgi:hypothetical protein
MVRSCSNICKAQHVQEAKIAASKLSFFDNLCRTTHTQMRALCIWKKIISAKLVGEKLAEEKDV